jgi:hypothetical protein
MSIGCETKVCHQHFGEPRSAICKDWETWAEAQASSAHWGTSPVGRYNLASWGDPYHLVTWSTHINQIKMKSYEIHSQTIFLIGRSSHPCIVRRSKIHHHLTSNHNEFRIQKIYYFPIIVMQNQSWGFILCCSLWRTNNIAFISVVWLLSLCVIWLYSCIICMSYTFLIFLLFV